MHVQIRGMATYLIGLGLFCLTFGLIGITVAINRVQDELELLGANFRRLRYQLH